MNCYGAGVWKRPTGRCTASWSSTPTFGNRERITVRHAEVDSGRLVQHHSIAPSPILGSGDRDLKGRPRGVRKPPGAGLDYAAFRAGRLIVRFCLGRGTR